MDDLRSWWEVPSIAHFCSLFRSAFDLTDFDIEDLEEGLLESQNEEGSAFLVDLLCRLLNGCYSRKDISVANYDLYVKDIIKYRWDGSDNPIKEKSEFKTLSLREKVELIYSICETRVDAEDVTEQLKGFEGDSMRVEPLGKDKDGAQYWYFYGTRLYVEDPEKKKELSKEEKRAKDRERRIEAKKKKLEEKRQRKAEKRKLKALRKAERKKKLEEAARNQQAEETSTRRSGRLRNKKIEIPESESSETSSSSSEEAEEETEESSQEEYEEVETVQHKQNNSKGKKQPPKKTPAKKNTKKGSTKTNEEENESEVEEETPAKTGRAKGRGSKTPAKTPAKKDTGNKKTESTPKETPKTTRSGRRSVAPERTPNQESSSGTRRSSRSSKKPSTPALPSPYNSETEEENEYDVDSGHESAGSGVSKMSVRSSTSRKSLQVVGKSSRKPTANVHLRRDLSGGDEEEDIDGEEEVENEEEMDTEENKHAGDDTVEDGGDKTGDPVHNKDENAKSDESGNQDANPEQNQPISEQNNAEDSLSENKTDINSDNTSQELKSEIKQENNDVEEIETTENKGSVQPIKEESDEVKEEEVNVQEKGKVKEEMDAENENEDTEVCDSKEVTEEHNGEYKRVLRKREVEEDKKDTSESKQNVKKAKLTLDRPAEAPKHSTSSTRWHLVCETLEDWINLAEWFKDSTVKCEKSLSKLIREDFLPVLPEIFEAREKEKMKRLLQEQELRRSNRITIKMREKMEQEKILAEALAEEEKARIRAEEEKRLKEEQLKLEEENKLREERRLAREERAQRLRLREERAQLLAEGKEIPPEMIYTGSQKYKDDEDSDDSRCDLKEEEDYQALMKVISAMKYHKDCWPFLEPVTDEQAPGYSDVIKRPMDMTKIEEKLENREYRSTRHFLSDFRLMFNNCKRFNGADSEFSECARSMEQMLKKYMKRFVSEEPTDKYYEDQDFVVSGGKGGARGEKRYRPQRAASSRAIETVHKALNDHDESDTDEDDIVPQRKKPRDDNTKDSPFKTQSHHSLLLQEMIELKRQREKKLAASALHNHQVITRGAERIRIPNQEGGGVMIIPKGELNPTGVLRMAATREIRRKVGTQAFAGTPPPRPVIHNLGSNNAVVTKKDPGLSIIDQTTPGSNQPKTIRIVASNVNGQPSVKQTAENVKISADGYLIISGKNSGIKVTENTKIVIQPPGAAPPSADGSNLPVGVGKEIVFKKMSTPASLKTLPGLSLSSTSGSPLSLSSTIGSPSIAAATGNVNNSANATPVRIGQPAVIKTIQSVPSGSSQAPANANSTGGSPVSSQQRQGLAGTGSPIDLQGLLRQTAVSSNVNEQQLEHLRGIVQKLENAKTPLSPDMMKKLDIAQRILLLNQKKRSLMEQRQVMEQKQEQLQHISLSQHQQKLSSPSKSPDARASNSGAIEQILREPGVNIDNQLGSVSKSVISNVNIAGDILDSYYSVMNEAKSKTMAANGAAGITHPVTRPVTQPVTQSGNLDQTNIKLPTPQSPFAVQRTLEQIITAGNSESPKPVQSQGTISEVTRQIYNLINKSGTGGIVEALARAQLMKQNSQLLQKQVSSNQNQSPVNLNSPTKNLLTNPTVTTVQTGLQIPVSPNQSQLISSTVVTQSGLYVSQNSVQSTTAPAETFLQQESQMSHGSVQSDSVQPVSAFQCGLQTSGSPTGSGLKTPSTNQNILVSSDTQLSVGINQGQINSPPSTSISGIDSKTILDLLRSSLAVKSESPSSEVSPIEALLSKTSTSPKSDSILKAHLTQALTNKMSTPRQNIGPQTVGVMQEKSDRQNLFDTFEAQPQGVNVGVAMATSNEIDMKERLKGVKVPTNSTLNYGSPLKTISIMEALKSKLHTLKPDQQVADTTTHTVTEADHEGHCICSELSHHSPSCGDSCGLSSYSEATVASETFNSFSACNRSLSPNCSVELPNSGVPFDIVQSEKIPQNIRGNETKSVRNSSCPSESDISSSSDYAENKFKLNADVKIAFDRDLDVVVPWHFVEIGKSQHHKSNFEKPMRLVIKGRTVKKIVVKDLHREKQIECKTVNDKNTCSNIHGHGKAGIHLTVNTVNGEEEVARYEQNEQGDWVLTNTDNEEDKTVTVSVSVQTDENNNNTQGNAVNINITETSCNRVETKVSSNAGDMDNKTMLTGETTETDALPQEAGLVYVCKKPETVCAESTEREKVTDQIETPSENLETVDKISGNVEIVLPKNTREPLQAKGFCFIKMPFVMPWCDKPQSESPVKETVTRRTYCSRSDMGLESCHVQNYVVQRPLLKSKSLGNISHPVVNSDPDYLFEPLLPRKKIRSRRKIPSETSTEALEKDLTNVRLKTKVRRLSVSPVKMYKIPGLKQIATGREQTPFKFKNIYDSKGPCRKSVHEVKYEDNFSDPPDEVQIACEALMKLADDDSAFIDNENTFETETSLEGSLSCNEDFFSTELLSDFFPSNPVDGDGSDVDHDLEQIEDDIFELQDQYPSSKSFVGNLPAINEMGLSTRVTSPSNFTSQPAASGQMFNADIQSVPQPVVLRSQRPSVPQQQVPGVHGSTLQAPGVHGSTLQASSVQGSTLQAPGVQISTLQASDVQRSRQQAPVEQKSLQQSPRIQVNQPVGGTGIQLSSTLLAVLQKAAGGMVLNPATQTAMIQHLTSLLNKRQPNTAVSGQNLNTANTLQVGNQNISPSISVQNANIALQVGSQNILSSTNNQLNSIQNQSKPTVLNSMNCSQQNVEYQDISQTTNPNLVSSTQIQTNSVQQILRHMQANSAIGNSCAAETNLSSANLVSNDVHNGLTGGGYVEYSPATSTDINNQMSLHPNFGSDFNSVTNANNGQSSFTSNVLPTEGIDCSEQSGFQVTQSNMDSAGTSQIPSFYAIPENQSVENEENN